LKRYAAILFAVAMLALAARPASAAYQVSLEASASDDTVKLDKVFIYSIVVTEYGTTDKRTRLAEPDFKPFTVEGVTRSTESQVSNGTAVRKTKLNYAIYCSKPGKYTLGPAKFLLEDPVRGTKQEMVSNPVEVTVLDEEPGILDDIRDIKEPKTFLDHIKRIFYLALAIGVLIAIALAALIIWALRRRKKKAKTAPAPAAPAVDPRVKALEALRLAERLISDPREFYTAVTDALRVYLWDARNIHAVESTTAELISLARAARMPSELVDELHSLFDEADLVKFAKYVPEAGDMRVFLDLAREFVKRA